MIWAARCQPARRCYRPQLLVIDEIGRGTQGDWLDGLLFQIVDYRYRAGRMTILMGNLEPATLGDIVGASILSRMNDDGGVFDLFERNDRA